MIDKNLLRQKLHEFYERSMLSAGEDESDGRN